MIRIAFCDDDPHFLPLLHQAVSQWFTRTQGATAFCCEDFLSGAALLASLETGSFDLFFLDIEMPGMDGMEVAAPHPTAAAGRHSHFFNLPQRVCPRRLPGTGPALPV